MSGIVINIDPMLHFGGISINLYGLVIVVAVIVGLSITLREAKRKGIVTDEIWGLAPWMLLAGIIGARLFHVIDRWEEYSQDLGRIFAIQQGGLAIWGALLGGLIAIAGYAQVRHISLRKLLDTFVPGVLAAAIIGRIACIINGDAYGGVTSLPWGFIYLNPASHIPGEYFGVPTQPYPVYEMLINGAILLLVLKLRRHIATDGVIFFIFLSLYSIGRFALTFLRQETEFLFGLQQAQVVSLLIFLLAGIAIVYLVKRRPVTVEAV
ncbi:MAG: prolipoprotein diacylglyceryl transferase [Dehalococcoidia bacterium]|nr:prolipoprotein diacylglyceryl transferase [Dehalococcoidia bacterium]